MKENVWLVHARSRCAAIQGWGPVNIGLSWPGRYSHGPAELLDLRDVDSLIRLIAAIANDGR